MKHVASLVGILAVVAFGSAGQFGCAAGTTTVETGDDGTGDDDGGGNTGNDSGGGGYDTGTGTHNDSGTTTHDSGTSGVDSGGGGFDSGGGGFDSGGGGFDSGGGGQDTGTTGGSCPNDQQFTTQACQSCMDSMCCNEGTACAEDQDCQGLIGCLQSCSSGDTNCEDDCSLEYSDAVQEYNDLGDCLTASCDTQCQ